MTHIKSGLISSPVRSLVALFAIVWLFGCASRQVAVAPYHAEQLIDGVVYHLPKTGVRIHLIVAQHTFTPGSLVAYAPRYLGEQYNAQAYTRYSVERAVMYAYGAADRDLSFVIPSTSRISVEQLIDLTPDGILYALNGESYTAPTHDYLSELPKQTGSADVSRALPQDYALATSRAKQAEIAAGRLFEIKERRLELLSGQVETMPCDGAALKMVIQGLDEQITAIESMFTGTKQVRYFEEILDVEISDPVKQLIIARFAPQYGVVDKEDLSGAPISIDVQEMERYLPLGEKESKALSKSSGIRYLQPGRAKITLHIPSSSLTSSVELPIAQWGRLSVLEEKMGVTKEGLLPYTIYFDPTSGAMKTVELAPSK